MDEKILCVLAEYDDETQARLAQMQNRLYETGFTGTHTKNLIQHITLGTFKPCEQQRVESAMRQAAGDIEPFDVSFSHIGVFGGAKVLFVAPDVSRTMLRLKEHFGDSFGWTAHTTMLIDQPEAVYRALPVIADSFTGFSGRVTGIRLYEFWPTRHIYSIGLGERACRE